MIAISGGDATYMHYLIYLYLGISKYFLLESKLFGDNELIFLISQLLHY